MSSAPQEMVPCVALAGHCLSTSWSLFTTSVKPVLKTKAGQGNGPSRTEIDHDKIQNTSYSPGIH